LVVSGLLLAALPAVAAADPGDIGHLGPSMAGAGSAPSGSKPESKLWFNDGSWWASLWSVPTHRFTIQRLDLVNETWVDTGVQVDERSSTRADTLWDGTKLYIASHRFSSTNTVGYPARLLRYSYNAGAKTYTLDAGFPVTINNLRTETLVIDKDSTGTIWATWTQNSQVFVSHTSGSDTNWVTPYLMPGPGTTVDPDDVSSVVAFHPPGTGRIGVMWSNQLTDSVYFAIHVDGQPDNVWDSSHTALQGSKNADDHMNLKSVQADGGKVYAAVKTSQTSASAALMLALVFNPATGTWSSSVIGRVSDSHTRAIIVVDEEQDVAHVYLTGPQPPSTNGQAGGSIYEKTAPLNTLAFATGVGTPIIRDADIPDMNDASSTKQNVSSATGVVVLASNDTTDRYWWHFDPLGGSPPVPDPPVANFSATPTSGPSPLVVSFTDLSTNVPTSWAWDFDDNGTVDSTARNPTFTYPAPGTYAVKLTASNAAGSDSETKAGFITVGGTLAFATFAPSADAYVTSSNPTKNYGTNIALRVRAPSNAYRSYLTFTTSGLVGTVRSATLRVFVTDASPVGGTVYSVANGWTETGITWNNAPALGAAVGTAGATTNGTWKEIDLGSAIGGNGTFSVAIASTSTNSAYYSSRQGSNPPQLVIGYEPGGPPPPAPVADFSGTPTSGPAPLSVAFTDGSTNSPTSWAWDFDNDGSVDSTAQNPTYIYTAAGTYSVKLTATNAGGPGSLVRTDYVTVSEAPPPPATFTVVTSADSRVSQQYATSIYGSDPSLRVRLDPSGSHRAYTRFAVSGITGTVTSVKLRLFVTDASPAGGTVYPTSSAWTESTLNWNNAPAATGAAIRAIGSTTLNAWVEVDLTGAVAANGTYDFLISDGSSNSAFYSSREGAQPPELVITQTP
jgi:PKD repeat protein